MCVGKKESRIHINALQERREYIHFKKSVNQIAHEENVKHTKHKNIVRDSNPIQLFVNDYICHRWKKTLNKRAFKMKNSLREEKKTNDFTSSSWFCFTDFHPNGIGYPTKCLEKQVAVVWNVKSRRCIISHRQSSGNKQSISIDRKQSRPFLQSPQIEDFGRRRASLLLDRKCSNHVETCCPMVSRVGVK